MPVKPLKAKRLRVYLILTFSGKFGLAYIWLPDGTLFNKLLIEEGYARYYPWFTFKFEEDFRAAP